MTKNMTVWIMNVRQLTLYENGYALKNKKKKITSEKIDW